MSSVNLGKESFEFQMFQNYWGMMKEHWMVADHDAYWEKVISDSHLFYQKYHTPYAKDLTCAFMNELDRKSKAGPSNEMKEGPILGKESFEFQMFRDYWNMMKEHWEIADDNKYWEKVISDNQLFYEKYHTPYAKDLALAFVNELDRKSKVISPNESTVEKEMNCKHTSLDEQVTLAMAKRDQFSGRKEQMRHKKNLSSEKTL